MIRLYSKPGCQPCKATKRALDKLGIEYEQFDVTTDPSAAEAAAGYGYTSLPIVVVDENTHWGGHCPSKLEKLA